METDIINQSLFSDPIPTAMVADFDGKEWSVFRHQEIKDIGFSPLGIGLHYSQAVFEGFLAIRNTKGNRLCFFRIEDHLARLNRSCERLVIPPVVPDKMVKPLTTWLKKLDLDDFATYKYIYIRPLIIATDNYIGVRVSNTFRLVILLFPMADNMRGMAEDVLITGDIRAHKNGTGDVKFVGNYAPALLAKTLAKKQGYDNVLFLDVTQKYVEELMTNNIFFVLNNKKVLTPPIDGNILPGITRDSVIKLLRVKGYEVVENKHIPASKIFELADKGTLVEMFGTGTASGIFSINMLSKDGKAIRSVKNIPVTTALKKALLDIQTGVSDDTYNWLTTI